MRISAPFIARPIATWLLAAGILIAGAMGWSRLPVSALPQVDFPTIQVSTRLPGAAADTMAELVTTPLERQLGLISGLRAMTSTSSQGTSAITLQFDLAKSIDVASEDVQGALDAAKGVLPPNLPYPPTYSKVNPADPPILTLALTSDTLPLTKINDAADTLLAQKLSQVTGVGRVLVEGGQRPAWRVAVEPDRLAAYNLTMEDVRGALSKANANLSKGSFDGPTRSTTIGSNDQIATVAEYEDTIVAWAGTAAVRVRDVGTVSEGVEDSKTAGWFNGKPAVIVDVQRQPGENVVATAERVKAILPQLRQALPGGIEVSVLADRTGTIRASVLDVEETLILTILLVVGVIWGFLKSPRATAVPAVALPLSLVGTFGLMHLFGFSLDNLSLMALTISAGFVVDDAIVMIENIVRHMEKGLGPVKAALAGAQEIGFTIVSLTVSLIAVFIPLLFMGGVVGRLFREFALVLTLAVVVSAVVSLTLTPMMCARILRKGHAEAPEGGFFTRLTDWYARSLDWALAHGRIVGLSAAAALAGTIALYVWAPKGFLPVQDVGTVLVSTDARDDVSYGAMAKMQAAAEAAALADPAVFGTASFIGAGTINPTGNTGHATVVLKPRAEREGTAEEIARRLSESMGSAGMEAHAQAAQDVQISSRQSRTQYQYTLSDADGAELAAWKPKLVAALRALPELSDVADDSVEAGAGIRVQIDRTKAALLGVSPSAVDDILYDAFGQRQVSTVYGQANQYHVILEADAKTRSDPGLLGTLRVRASTGAAVPISSFAALVPGTSNLSVSHEAQFPSSTLSFNLSPGASLGEAVDAVEKAQVGLGAPESIRGAFSGDSEEFRSSLADEPWLILAAVVVIYIVLGVLYESLIHPITILSTLPSAGVGALLALRLFGMDLSLVALIGIVLLMGIVKKNAIMMIDFALAAERGEGKTPFEAIREACLLRFRPIMMTTMAALLGALPLALGTGEGSELRRPMGVAIVGGLLLSQLLTLYTTPVIYLWLDRISGGGNKKGMEEDEDKNKDDDKNKYEDKNKDEDKYKDENEDRRGGEGR